MEPLEEPFLLGDNANVYPSDEETVSSITAAGSGFHEENISQSLQTLIRSNQTFHEDALEESMQKNKSLLLSRALRSSKYLSDVQSETTRGCCVSPEFEHRQQWKLRKDGVTYENTGMYEDRRARWMDIFFDLILAGLSLRCAELSLRSQREPEYDIHKHWLFMIASYGSCIAVWAQVTNHRNRYHLKRTSWLNTVIIAIFIAMLAFEINAMEYCVKSLMCTASTNDILGGCKIVFLANALKFLFCGMISFYIAKTDTLMHKFNFLNGLVMLFVSFSFLVLYFIYDGSERCAQLWAVLSLTPLIAIPLGSRFIPGINEVYQPLNTHYFLERLGLLIISLLAVLMETLFAHSCTNSPGLCDNGNNRTVFRSEERDDHHGRSLAPYIKLGVCLLYALFIKMSIFNIYTASILDEQVSPSTKYDITNDARIFSGLILATGIAILSNEMNRDASVCELDKGRNISDLNEFGEIIVSFAMTSFHYVNTWRSKKWTWWKTIIFWSERILLQAIGRVLAHMTKDVPQSINQLDPLIYASLMLVSFYIEKHFLNLPTNHGKEQDAQILVEMIQAECDATKN